MKGKCISRHDIGVGVLLSLSCAHLLLLAHGSVVNGHAWDEAGHLVAGLEHWHEGTHELYKVNPPLPRMVATLPVVLSGHRPLRIDSSSPLSNRPEWPTAVTFVEDHGARFFDYLTWARWASTPFSLLGAFVCYHWARELAGELAGLVAFACWCLGPTMIANAQLITPDMAATSMGVLAAYTFRGWLQLPAWKSAVAAGVCFGLALLCKMTWIVLFGLWPALWLALRWLVARPVRQSDNSVKSLRDPHHAERGGYLDKRIYREFAQLCMILAVGIGVLNLGYGFDGSFRRLDKFDFVSKPLRGTPDGQWEGYPMGNRFRGTIMGHVLVPLPAPFVEGIDLQRNEFDIGYWSYLLGVHRREGWWYFYALALLWKVPVGFWIVAFVGTLEWLHCLKRAYTHKEGCDGLCSRSNAFRCALAEALMLLAPAVTILVLVSSHTGFTHHLRYVLPAFPFGFIWASRAATAILRGYNWRSALTACGLAWGISSSLCATPNHLAYFNELVGGPTNAHHYMGLGPMDSTLDWGQDLLRLAEWTRNHPQIELDGVAYGGLEEIRNAAGITGRWPPSGNIPANALVIDVCQRGPRPGWYAASVSQVFSDMSEYNYFQHFEPFTMVGKTVYIYHISEQDADRVWQKLHRDKYDRSDCSWHTSP